jgi:hypothetical protein
MRDVALLTVALFLVVQARSLLRRPKGPGAVPDDLAQELATIKVTLDIHGKALRDLVETADHQGEALRELIESNVDEHDDLRRQIQLMKCYTERV